MSRANAVAVLAVGFAALALAGRLLNCERVQELLSRGRTGAPAADDVAEPLSQTFTADNGLMTLHYPPAFAAQPSGKGIMVLSRNLPDGADVLVFAAVAEPISREPGEFTRVAARAESNPPADWEYRKVSETKTTCNGLPGVEIVANWQPAGAKGRALRRWCAFLRDGHGYMFSYSTPETVAKTHEPRLRAIVEATTFPALDGGAGAPPQ